MPLCPFVLRRSSEGGVQGEGGGRGQITNRGAAAPRRAGAGRRGAKFKNCARGVAAVSGGGGGGGYIMDGAWARLRTLSMPHTFAMLHLLIRVRRALPRLLTIETIIKN